MKSPQRIPINQLRENLHKKLKQGVPFQIERKQMFIKQGGSVVTSPKLEGQSHLSLPFQYDQDTDYMTQNPRQSNVDTQNYYDQKNSSIDISGTSSHMRHHSQFNTKKAKNQKSGGVRMNRFLSAKQKVQGKSQINNLINQTSGIELIDDMNSSQEETRSKGAHPNNNAHGSNLHIKNLNLDSIQDSLHNLNVSPHFSKNSLEVPESFIIGGSVSYLNQEDRTFSAISGIHQQRTERPVGGINKKYAQQQQNQSKPEAYKRIISGDESMCKVLMDEIIMMRNKHGKNMQERIVRQNNQNFDQLFPQSFDRYNPDEVMKQQKKDLRTSQDYGKPKYLKAQDVNPHHLIQSLNRDLSMNDEQKMKFLQRTIDKLQNAVKSKSKKQQKDFDQKTVTSEMPDDGPDGEINEHDQAEKSQKKESPIKANKLTVLKKPQSQAVRKNIQLADEHGIFDHNCIRYRAPHIYQYTNREKFELCHDDDDYFNFVKRNYKSVRSGQREIMLQDKIKEMKPTYTMRMEDIMYPEKSILDEFLYSRGLHKDPKKNFKMINGQVVFNPCWLDDVKKKKQKMKEKEEAELKKQKLQGKSPQQSPDKDRKKSIEASKFNDDGRTSKQRKTSKTMRNSAMSSINNKKSKMHSSKYDTMQTGTPAPGVHKKVNFFKKQTKDKKVEIKEQKMLEQKQREMQYAMNNKDKRLMSKADMVHLLEDSMNRAEQAGGEDSIVKDNCKNFLSSFEKQHRIIHQRKNSLPIRVDKQKKFYETPGIQTKNEDFHDRMDNEYEQLEKLK